MHNQFLAIGLGMTFIAGPAEALVGLGVDPCSGGQATACRSDSHLPPFVILAGTQPQYYYRPAPAPVRVAPPPVMMRPIPAPVAPPRFTPPVYSPPTPRAPVWTPSQPSAGIRVTPVQPTYTVRPTPNSPYNSSLPPKTSPTTNHPAASNVPSALSAPRSSATANPQGWVSSPIPAANTPQPPHTTGNTAGSGASNYTFQTTPYGTVQVMQNGRVISTTSAQNAATQYGYMASPSNPTSHGSVTGFPPPPVSAFQWPSTTTSHTTPTTTNGVGGVGASAPGPASQPSNTLAGRLLTIEHQLATPNKLTISTTAFAPNITSTISKYGLDASKPPVSAPGIQCTTFAQNFSRQIGVNANLPSGDARTWYDAAIKPGSGLRTLSPQTRDLSAIPVGSVIVWDTPRNVITKAPDSNTPGHVAVIVANNGNSVTVAEANWPSNHMELRTLSYDDIRLRPNNPLHGEKETLTLLGFITPN